MAVLRPRTNPIGSARSAQRRGWERRDGVRIRGYLGVPSVRIPLGGVHGPGIERKVGDRRGEVGMIDDHRIQKRLWTSQHRMHSELDNPIDNQNRG